MVQFRAFILLATLFQAVVCQQLPTWSVCDSGYGFGNCFNSAATGDCAAMYSLNVISASVEGLFVMYANKYSGGQEDDAIGVFQFGHTFGLNYSYVVSEEISRVNCIRRVGDQRDYKLSTITTFGRLEFLTDNMIGIIREDIGAPGDCSIYPVQSFILSGNEDWTIYRNDGTSACLRPSDPSSFIPALVKDTRTIGFELNSICAFKKGCHSELVHHIDNYETSGVLRRTE